MELDQLKKNLQAAKLYPIHIEGSSAYDDSKDHRFIGSLDEYLEAARALGISAILIRTQSLAEEHFFYVPDDDEMFDDDTDPIDLCSITPELRELKRHAGSIAAYKLSTALTNCSLDFFITETWWDEFLSLHTTTTDKVNDNLIAAVKKSREAQEAKERETLKALSALIRDPQFTRLPTQKAMIAYAADQIPELKTTDESVLRTAIQNIHAMIKAKGLDRKRRA